jgi:hypothetical protein
MYLSNPFGWLDNGNYKADRGNGLEDQPQRLVISWVWAPTFTHRDGAFFKYVVNNWQISSLTTINSARPYTSPTVYLNDLSSVPGMFGYSLNGSYFSTRAPWLPVNSVYQPAMYRADARISKALPFGERVKGFVFFEVFNLSNSWSPTAMTSQAYTETKGVITATPSAANVGTADVAAPDGTEARRMQAGLRITF